MKEVKKAVCKSCGGNDLKLDLASATLGQSIFWNFKKNRPEYKSGKKINLMRFYRHTIMDDVQFTCVSCGLTPGEITYTDKTTTSSPTDFLKNVLDITLPTPVCFTEKQIEKIKKEFQKQLKDAITKVKKNPKKYSTAKPKKKKEVKHVVKVELDTNPMDKLIKKTKDLIARCPENPSRDSWLARPYGIIHMMQVSLLEQRDNVMATVPEAVKEGYKKITKKLKDGDIIDYKTSIDNAEKNVTELWEEGKKLLNELKSMIKEKV